MSNSRTDVDLDRMAAMFKALASPQRLKLFLKLTRCCEDGTCGALTPAGMHRCVGDLGRDLGLAASTVSHHLKELRQAGLMHVERCGQRIDCWISDDAVRRLARFLAEAGEAPACGRGDVTSPGGRDAG